MTVKHVRLTSDEGKAWCGAELSDDPFFKDAEHCALNGLYHPETHAHACLSCVYIIIEKLMMTRYPTE